MLKDDIITIKSMGKEIRQRLKADFDAVLAVSGADPGIGKTHLGIQLGMQIDKNFDLDKNIAYLPDDQEIIEKFNKIDQYSVLQIDEAGNVLYKLQWMSRMQQSINQMYMTERKQNKCTILCIPRFTDLNEHFRNYRVKFWIWIPTRGVGILYRRDDDKDARDPWHFDDNRRFKRKFWERRGKRMTEITIEELVKIEKQTTNYVCHFTFDKLPEELENKYKEYHAKYKKISQEREIEKQLESMSTTSKRKELMLGKLIGELIEKTGMTQKEVSELLKCNVATTNSYLKIGGKRNLDKIMDN